MLRVIEHAIPGETSFEVHDEDDTDYRIVEIHPWNRPGYSIVYVSVGTYTDSEKGQPEDVEDNYWNIIVDREDFVEGILAVFPELKRAGDA